MTTHSEYERALKAAAGLVRGVKFMYLEQFAGVLETLIEIRGFTLNQDVIDAVKQAMCDEFHGGCEPEWENEHWKVWDSLSPESFVYNTKWGVSRLECLLLLKS